MNRKKKNRRKEFFGVFSSKVQNLTLFSINSMIRITIFGLPGINLESIFGRKVVINSRDWACLGWYREGHYFRLSFGCCGSWGLLGLIVSRWIQPHFRFLCLFWLAAGPPGLLSMLGILLSGLLLGFRR